MLDWGSQNSINRPAFHEAMVQYSVGNPSSLGPFPKGQGFPVERVESVGAHVSGLFVGQRPAAIARLVASIVVGVAIQGMFWRWAASHVRQETLERIAPLVAHRDATSAVIFIILGFGIKAAVLRMRPCAVFRAERIAVASSHLSDFTHLFPLETSAGLSTSSEQRRLPHYGGFAAGAHTCPQRHAATGRHRMCAGLFNYGQATDNGANVNRIRINSWHSDLLDRSDVGGGGVFSAPAITGMIA